MKHLKLTYYLLAIVTVLGFLNGCSVEDDITPNTPSGNKEKVAASFTIQLSASSIDNTRSSSTTEGNEAENKIKSVTIFIADKGTKSVIKTGAFFTSQEGQLNATASLVVTEGNKNIFVGINLSNAQADLFVKNYNSENALGNISNISEVTTDNGFSMFGLATTLDGSSNTITIEKGISSYNMKANVTRMVAKIIVACKLSDAEKDLLNVNNGYVKRTDVKYIINTTNQKFYFAGNADKADPNYNLSDWLDNNGNPISGKDLTREFFYNTNNVFTSGNTAEVHTDDVKTYTNGYYCLENTVNNNINLTSVGAAQKVATYVRIGYKFTPNRLYNNGNVNIYTYEQALEITNIAGGTFYIYNKAPKADRNICYVTLNDIKAHYNLQNLAPEDYTEYKNGRIERNCFVNSVDFNNGASVVRNNYYILTLQSISLPIDNNSIEINTESVGWTLKGNTTVDFEPNM